MIWVLVAATLVAAVPAGLRWLRVAQREHYLAPAATRFAVRWWRTDPANLALAALAIAGVVASFYRPVFGVAVAVAQVGPIGLGVRGRTSPLAWTPRLRRVAGVAGGIFLACVAVGAALRAAPLVAGSLLLLPVIVDFALLLLAPVERRMGDRWVEKAAGKLRGSGTRVVAITGSYGKTTTKQYLHHLLADRARVVASPASFNNRMGLARAVNEQLVPGTEIFIAEMGTYGPGEIADLCRWVAPEAAAIVSIGPVHLERFGTEAQTVAAKAEILDGVARGVISVDHPLLAQLAMERSSRIPITTVSGIGSQADVTVADGALSVGGKVLGSVPEGVFPVNLAAAVALADALGEEVDPERFATLPRAEHRQTTSTSAAGFAILDDTFNSNPAGAARALEMLSGYPGTKVVVTPGMVELGKVQDQENEAFAEEAASVADLVVVVGKTNQKALLRGVERGGGAVTVVANRDEAVALVRERLGEGDAVLYENDLPDHYP